jgi:ketohexokinase
MPKSQKKILIITSPIGAGDTFIAGMLYALNCKDNDWSITECVEFGIKVAGMKVFQEGFSELDRALSP